MTAPVRGQHFREIARLPKEAEHAAALLRHLDAAQSLELAKPSPNARTLRAMSRLRTQLERAARSRENA